MTVPAPKPTSLRAIRDAIQKVAVALVAANDGKPHVIHPQITAEAVAALALLERIILDERPRQSAEPVAWYDLPMANIELADAIVQEWQKRVESGAPAMPWGTGELVELISKLRPAASPGPSELVEHPNPETQVAAEYHAPMVLIESPDYAEYLRTHPYQVPSQETQAATAHRSPVESVPVSELEKLATEWELRYGPTYGQKTHARADDLRALITRHRGNGNG